jgi:hypothetical protein
MQAYTQRDDDGKRWFLVSKRQERVVGRRRRYVLAAGWVRSQTLASSLLSTAV